MYIICILCCCTSQWSPLVFQIHNCHLRFHYSCSQDPSTWMQNMTQPTSQLFGFSLLLIDGDTRRQIHIFMSMTNGTYKRSSPLGGSHEFDWENEASGALPKSVTPSPLIYPMKDWFLSVKPMGSWLPRLRNYMIRVRLLGCADGKLSWLADFFETFYQDYNIFRTSSPPKIT